MGNIKKLDNKLQGINESAVSSRIMRNPNLPEQANNDAMSTFNRKTSALLLGLDPNMPLLNSQTILKSTIKKKVQ